MPIRLRFHLGRGPHYMHWQVRDIGRGGVTSYHDPDKTMLILADARVRRRRTASERIHSRQTNKTVCAWLECSHCTATQGTIAPVREVTAVMFNPHRDPCWLLQPPGHDIMRLPDDTYLGMVATSGRRIYLMHPQEIVPFLPKTLLQPMSWPLPASVPQSCTDAPVC